MLLKELIARTGGPGRVAWIGLRGGRRAEMAVVEAAGLGPDGLAGDHARPGKRAVTLIQAEHLAVIGALAGREVGAELLRRNLVVAGINLNALKGREVAIGGAVLRWTVPCHPCSRMEEALGPGGYAAMRGHGGWCAEVVVPGRVAIGDAVRADA
ncbi:MOSC domain-containing protein [Roseobacter sp. HKCCA0434]|uniref:MOSC domain-containing protein n=1 Tax=Roseobacter sp. HKCCA0434 TaxID=3079297 RepID=UPI002905DFFB|nr:MOSC domain-containing protein [Roseobacter sp. HKCCA0434]